MKTRANQRILSVLLALVMVLALSCALLLVTAADEANHVTVNGTEYATLEAAIAEAEPVNGVITYEISGKVEVTSADGWIQVLKDGLTDVTAVKFVGKTENAEISITNSTSVLADQKYDLDVSFEGLVLSHPNGAWVNDLGHATNYFACALRNTDAAENTVTYTNCTFPDGACNNWYGKTVFDGCTFKNAATGEYNLWNYGGKETEVKNSTFTGTRGIKTYNEGTLAVAPTVKIEDTSFTGLTEKAAIVASKATDITLVKVDATGCTEGVLQKDIENSGEKTTIKANGTGISGGFNVTAETGADAAKKEFNITGGTFDTAVDEKYCADGFIPKANDDGTYGVKEGTYVARINGVGYETLAEAIAAAKDGDTITLVANADMTSTIYITDGRKLTLALNGFDVTITETGKNFRVCNAEFTVTGNGTIREQNPYFAPIILKGGPEGSVDYTVVNIGAGVVLEGWAGVMVDQTLNTANNYGMTLNVDGATLRGVNDTDGASGSGLYVNGVVCDAKITLTNTTVTGTGTGMYLAGYAETTVTGGSVKGDTTGIEIRAGKLTLNNCTVTGGQGEVVTDANGNGATVENAALAVSQHTTKKPIEVVINGGTFTATAAVYQTDVQGTGSADVKTSVKDGTFNGIVKAETTGAVAVSGGTFSAALDETVCAPGFIPKANDDGTYGVKEGTYVARINGVGYETLAEAIAAAKDGDTVTILSDITGENVTVDKSLVIAGNNTAALTNVIITASGRISLTLQGLKFSGNSYVNANGCEALTVENCEADVTPTKITGRAAFIVLGTAEVGDGAKGLTLVVRDSTIVASKGENANGDAFAAAIFGWNFIKSADISGNIFGSETTPYTFIAVKLMNVTADAKFTVTGNTVYGTNETYGFYAFDLYQNNSRENAYETVFSGNELRNTNTGVSENDFYFVDVEANGTGNAKVNVKSDNKVNGEVVKASDLLVEEKGNNRYVGIDIVTDEAGKIIGGILAANSGTDELADGFTAVKNEDGSCTVKAEVIVIVTSDPENSGILSGGGKYAEGTKVTLVARAVTDYTFLGWYDKDGVLVSEDLTYTFTATADASFTAKFKSDAKRKLTVSVGHGEVEYTYENADGTGTDTWENDITDNLFARGTRFTVTAKPLAGYTFLYWINADGRILTEETAYEFLLGDNVKLTACYRKTEGAKPYVIFRDLNDKILQAGDATDGYVTVPAHNTFAGYTFLGWFDAEGNELTVTDSRIAVTGNLTVYARYKANDGLTLIVDGTADMETYSYGDKVTVTADEMKDGKYFSGWYIGDMIVSDRLGYTFYITGDTVLETRYEGDEPLVRQPIAAMTASDRQTLEDGRQSVTFYVSWTLPEGYEMVEAGVILTPSEAKKDVLTLPISEADKNTIFKYSSILTGDTGTYAYTQNLKGNARSWNVYAVGYVICRDTAGNTMTLYTSVFTSAAQ